LFAGVGVHIPTFHQVLNIFVLVVVRSVPLRKGVAHSVPAFKNQVAQVAPVAHHVHAGHAGPIGHCGHIEPVAHVAHWAPIMVQEKEIQDSNNDLSINIISHNVLIHNIESILTKSHVFIIFSRLSLSLYNFVLPSQSIFISINLWSMFSVQSLDMIICLIVSIALCRSVCIVKLANVANDQNQIIILKIIIIIFFIPTLFWDQIL